MQRNLVRFLFTLILLPCFSLAQGQNVRLLILSGRNNHDWKSTTSCLKYLYDKSGGFEVEITEAPDTLSINDLVRFDVVVSNWSSFPDSSYRWPGETEEALENFIKSGGGFVSIHAATTAFNQWAEFKEMTTGAWVKDTWHGKISPTQVSITDHDHPVTAGMENFVMLEELWVHAELNPSFEVLATALNEDLKGKALPSQPVLTAREYGAGRIVHTALGHDARIMRNTGFETLLLRGTEWAATGKVFRDVPQELNLQKKAPGKYRWEQSDSTITLLDGNRVVWRYNFLDFRQKPYFHPVYLGRNNLTCVSPDDHPWHAGQWFSWKYINGVNYWEYVNKKEYRSEGITRIKHVHFRPQPDFSAEIELDIVYHPAKGKDVLAENRRIRVSAPDDSQNLTMDYSFHFEALEDLVEISRTPLQDEANGQSWGGYGGLSMRFNQSFMIVKTLSGWKGEKEHAVNGPWFYMGFTGIDGEQVGTQIMIAPGSEREESAWYVTKDESLPFFYFGPAYLFYKALSLKKGEDLQLKYRVNHFPGSVSIQRLEKEYTEYIDQLTN
jgi:type 1 glutamine amidotransferase